jgi:hypothetical protein
MRTVKQSVDAAIVDYPLARWHLRAGVWSEALHQELARGVPFSTAAPVTVLHGPCARRGLARAPRGMGVGRPQGDVPVVGARRCCDHVPRGCAKRLNPLGHEILQEGAPWVGCGTPSSTRQVWGRRFHVPDRATWPSAHS